MLRIIASCMAGILLAMPASAQPDWDLSGMAAPLPERIDFEPAPDFVQPVTAPTPEDAEFEAYSGVQYLLVDDQQDMRGEEPVLYYRMVMEALNVSGVEVMANFDIGFDPAWETIAFNHVRVIRDGEVLDRQDAIQIDIVRQESDADRLMFNGRATALIRINDLRVGDVLDYAYTRRGKNPAYGEEYFRVYGLGWTVPVERRNLRSVWSRGDVEFWDQTGGDVTIARSREGRSDVFSLEPVPIGPINLETGTPSWVQQYPLLRISTFEDWNAVADWGRPLYRVERSDAVAEIAARISAEHDDPADQLVAALRFVQDEIRYLALTYGEGSFVPVAPDQTLQTRFGDCKAKTMLLLALAEALGIEADPALVSLGAGPGLDQQFPSPGAFDHIIVRARLNGQDYWLDPTASFRGGRLDVLEQADYGFALPLDRSGDGLVPMAVETPSSEPTLVVNEIIDIGEGRDAPATLTAHTVFTRGAADAMRRSIASRGRPGLQRDYLDFYNRYFGPSRHVEDMQIEDDREANRIVITEHVELADPYEDGEEDGAYAFAFVAHGVDALVNTESERRRNTPLAISYPIHSRHVIDLRLTNGGAGWDLEDQDETIENPGFRLRHRTWHRGAGYRMQFDLESLSRSVEADAAPEVLREHQDFRELVYYGFDLWNEAPDAEEAAPDAVP